MMFECAIGIVVIIALIILLFCPDGAWLFKWLAAGLFLFVLAGVGSKTGGLGTNVVSKGNAARFKIENGIIYDKITGNKAELTDKFVHEMKELAGTVGGTAQVVGPPALPLSHRARRLGIDAKLAPMLPERKRPGIQHLPGALIPSRPMGERHSKPWRRSVRPSERKKQVGDFILQPEPVVAEPAVAPVVAEPVVEPAVAEAAVEPVSVHDLPTNLSQNSKPEEFLAFLTTDPKSIDALADLIGQFAMPSNVARIMKPYMEKAKVWLDDWKAAGNSVMSNEGLTSSFRRSLTVDPLLKRHVDKKGKNCKFLDTTTGIPIDEKKIERWFTDDDIAAHIFENQLKDGLIDPANIFADINNEILTNMYIDILNMKGNEAEGDWENRLDYPWWSIMDQVDEKTHSPQKVSDLFFKRYQSLIENQMFKNKNTIAIEYIIKNLPGIPQSSDDFRKFEELAYHADPKVLREIIKTINLDLGEFDKHIVGQYTLVALHNRGGEFQKWILDKIQKGEIKSPMVLSRLGMLDT